MIKKLLFASILTIFSELSAMAQNAPFDLFIGTTNNFNYFWSKKPDGFIWNNTIDSVGTVTYDSPYEGADHMEFKYNVAGWWCAGAFTLNPYPWGPENFSGYTHLKLYWKGYSAANPDNTFSFSLSDPAGHTGPNAVVFDDCNTLGYQKKIVPLKAFLGVVYDWQNLPVDSLKDLNAISLINYSVSLDESFDNSWDGVSSGVWYMDAVQLVDWIGVDAGGIPVYHNGIFDFGNTSLGTPAAATTFTIKNAGESNLTLSGTPKITISGANAADFTIVQSGLISPITPSGNTSFTVTFNPSTIGAKTATLSIANDFSPTGKYVIVLKGTGQVKPEINLQAGTTNVNSGETVDFGILVAGTSKDTSFTIYNLGNANLTLSGTPKIAISGSSEFTVVQTGVTSPVAASGTTSFMVTYNPTSAGVKNAVITITNNDVDEGTYVVNLKGSATLVPEPEINVKAGSTSIASAGSFAFGSVNTGANSTVAFTIANIGNADLNLTGTPRIVVSGTAAADFTVNETATASPIASGSSTSFTVTFAPSAAGAKSASITIFNDDTNEGTYVINLTGSATVPAPEINIKAGTTSVPSAGSFAFGSLNTGANSTVTFTIENIGNTNLNLTGTPKIAVSGAADFTVNETTTSSPVASGSSTSFTVTFAPSSAGAKSATITISNDDTDEGTYVINLSGSATVPAPEINVKAGFGSVASAGSFGFGNVNTGANSTFIFTIENPGNASLNLTGTPRITISGASDFTVNQTVTSSTIASGASTSFTVTFAPSSVGLKTAVITIANNDADEGNYVINLTGTGKTTEINVKQGSLNIASFETFNFGGVNVSASVSTVTFTIENSGSGVLNLLQTPAIIPFGTDPTDFTVNVSGTSSTISGGSSTTFKVTFNPSSAGVKSAVLIITNNDNDEGSYVINLTGTGTTTTGLFGSTSNSFEAMVAPNPSNGIYNINTNEKIDAVIISDFMGKILLNNSDSQIDLSNQPSGIYFLTIISGEKRFFGKLVKN
jgi:hypothetical protein